MTSIEWLMQELYTEMNLSGNGRVLDEILEEAKEMHKQEMKEMYLKGIENYDPTFKRKDDTLKDYHIVDTNEMVDQVTDVRKMKRSAVTFLIEQIEGRGYFSNEFPLKRKTIEHIIKRALEIEQEIQETLYTEEQVREVAKYTISEWASLNEQREYDHEKLVKTWLSIELQNFIQSLKQPKQ